MADPESYKQNTHYIPKRTVFMNRQDPFQERDGTGQAFVNLESGREETTYKPGENRDRVVAYDDSVGHPDDREYQSPEKRTLSDALLKGVCLRNPE